MINLCYLKKKIIDQEEFYDQFLSTIFPHVDYSVDLVIASEKIKARSGIRIFYWEELDLESIYNIPLKNIFVLESDYISSSYMKSLISLKSKKSEIIGLSNYYNQNLKDSKIIIENFRDHGYSSDQIKIALILNYNYHPDIIDKIVSDSISNKLNNVKIKEIDEIEDILKFMKR